MKKLGFYYDIGRCIGCGACQVACKEKNRLPCGTFFRRAATLKLQETGEWQHFSLSCCHCEKAACTEVCPTGAMYKAKDGTVQHDDSLCISCGRCVHSCPYGAVSLHGVTGYAAKCDACADLRSKGMNPACVDACKTRALRFGPLEELEGLYAGEKTVLPLLPQETDTAPALCLVKGSAMDPEWKADPADADPRRAEEGGIRENAGDLRDENGAGHENDIGAEGRRQGSYTRGERILILGGGIAGVSAARAARSTNYGAHITMISNEPVLPYSRPMLSKSSYLSFSDSRCEVIGEEELKELRIRLIRGDIQSLDAVEHSVSLEDGRVFPYDKCIYALGMEAACPPIPGKERPGVHVLRSAGDLRKLRLDTRLSGRAVVIGAGITGIEAAWELHRAGLQVQILDMAPKLAGRLLDDRTAALLKEQLEKHGISVTLNASIGEITGNDRDKENTDNAAAGEPMGYTRVSGVRLKDGTIIKADLVLISTGYKSLTGLAEAAGAAADKGLLTDIYMKTTLPDLWACGDCTALGKQDWTEAVRQGEAAGVNAAGGLLAYEPKYLSSMLHAAGTSLLCAGNMDSGNKENSVRLYFMQEGRAAGFAVNPRRQETDRSFYSVCLKDDRVTGICILGSLQHMKTAEEAAGESWSRQKLCSVMQEIGASAL